MPPLYSSPPSSIRQESPTWARFSKSSPRVTRWTARQENRRSGADATKADRVRRFQVSSMAGAGADRKKPLLLDGAEGEGGGQILRSALTLSLVTGRAFRIVRIRAKRPVSGLRPQHLACVRGAVAISGGRGGGGEVGWPELEFRPQPAKSGHYVLEVGTAGSAALLLQCLYYPLILAGPSQLTLRGGTHVPQSPSYHYLAWVWL